MLGANHGVRASEDVPRSGVSHVCSLPTPTAIAANATEQRGEIRGASARWCPRYVRLLVLPKRLPSQKHRDILIRGIVFHKVGLQIRRCYTPHSTMGEWEFAGESMRLAEEAGPALAMGASGRWIEAPRPVLPPARALGLAAPGTPAEFAAPRVMPRTPFAAIPEVGTPPTPQDARRAAGLAAAPAGVGPPLREPLLADAPPVQRPAADPRHEQARDVGADARRDGVGQPVRQGAQPRDQPASSARRLGAMIAWFLRVSDSDIAALTARAWGLLSAAWRASTWVSFLITSA